MEVRGLSFSQVIADLVGLVLLVVTNEKRLQFLHAGRLVCPAPVDSIWPQGELFSAYVTGQDTPRVVLRSVNLGLAQLDGDRVEAVQMILVFRVAHFLPAFTFAQRAL